MLVAATNITDKATGELLARVTTHLFVRGIGGFGERGKVKNNYPEPPARAADATRALTTTTNQAFLYRLNGDFNPLHVDPQMSAMGGFDVPILHGLCTYGITARAIFEQYHPEDASRLKKIAGRFTSHVFPGETLVVEMWKNGNHIIFHTKTKERGKVVLKGVCELREEAKM